VNRKEIIDGFNLKIPVVASPMFIVSQVDLVLECCKNGIIGTFPALNNRQTDGFETWLIEIKEELKQYENQHNVKLPPYGVNLIVHKSNPRVDADLAVCVRQKVPIVITSLGAVRDVVDKVHSYGGLVFHDVINKRHAQKAIDAGVDGLILVCAGAGGHAGTLNPMPFVSEIRSMFDGVILLAGCISSGQDVASAMQMGADIAYMGTRFIATKEAIAQEAYKQMIIDSETKDIVYTASVSGVNANYIAASLNAAGITEEYWKNKAKINFGEKLEDAKAWKDIWSAGHGAATIKDNIPVKELIQRLQKEFKMAIERQSKLLEKF